MKPTRLLLPALLALGGITTGHVASRPALQASQTEARDLAARVQILEEQLLEVELQLGIVAADAAQQRVLVDETVAYIGRQAMQAESMVDVLQVSEDEGFTAGINPRSREVLLAGFRSLLAEAQAHVPGQVVTEPAPQSRR